MTWRFIAVDPDTGQAVTFTAREFRADTIHENGAVYSWGQLIGRRSSARVTLETIPDNGDSVVMSRPRRPMVNAITALADELLCRPTPEPVEVPPEAAEDLGPTRPLAYESWRYAAGGSQSMTTLNMPWADEGTEADAIEDWVPIPVSPAAPFTISIEGITAEVEELRGRLNTLTETAQSGRTAAAYLDDVMAVIDEHRPDAIHYPSRPTGWGQQGYTPYEIEIGTFNRNTRNLYAIRCGSGVAFDIMWRHDTEPEPRTIAHQDIHPGHDILAVGDRVDVALTRQTGPVNNTYTNVSYHTFYITESPNDPSDRPIDRDIF